jgi:hypothetical protein
MHDSHQTAAERERRANKGKLKAMKKNDPLQHVGIAKKWHKNSWKRSKCKCCTDQWDLAEQQDLPNPKPKDIETKGTQHYCLHKAHQQYDQWTKRGYTREDVQAIDLLANMPSQRSMLKPSEICKLKELKAWTYKIQQSFAFSKDQHYLRKYVLGYADAQSEISGIFVRALSTKRHREEKRKQWDDWDKEDKWDDYASPGHQQKKHRSRSPLLKPRRQLSREDKRAKSVPAPKWVVKPRSGSVGAAASSKDRVQLTPRGDRKAPS